MKTLGHCKKDRYVFLFNSFFPTETLDLHPHVIMISCCCLVAHFSTSTWDTGLGV